MSIAIIDYGAGNIKSVEFACNRLGYKAILTKNKQEILDAEKVIFPGVGAANNAMTMLNKFQLDDLIPNLKQPVLGICLGMQLLCKYSEEGDTVGLGIFDVNIKKFNNKLKVPQVGWNKISNLKSNLFLGIPEGVYIYLVHSYYADECEAAIATTDYGLRYASALKNDNFYGVQFHPEKSSGVGEQILNNFLEM